MQFADVLAYAFIAAAALIALSLLRSAIPTARLSPALRRKLSEKYSRFVNWVDLSSIVAVFVLSALYFLFFSSVKALLFPAPSGVLFYSAPVSELFFASFLLAIATAGGVCRKAASLYLGKDFWKYYDSERAGFDTRKAYFWIKVVFLVASLPFLVDGLQHRVTVTNAGVEYYDFFSLSTRSYDWSEIVSVENHGLEQQQGYFVLRFVDGKRLDSQNEAWNPAGQQQIASFIRSKASLRP